MAEVTNKFSTKEAIKFGWETVKKNLVFFAVITFAIIASSSIPSLYNALIEGRENAETYMLLMEILFAFISAGITLGGFSIMLKVVDGKKPTYSDLFSKFNFMLILKYISVTILYFLFVLVGLILLIIPGIIFAIRFSFCYYPLIDRNAGPIEAMKMSWEMTKGNFYNVLLLMLATIGILILGYITLLVGILIAYPIVILASIYAYRKLSPRHNTV